MEAVALIVALIALAAAVLIFLGKILNRGISMSLFKSQAAKISFVCFAVYAVSYAGFLYLHNS